MSICQPCTRLNDISLCTDSIYIGTVGTVSATYNVYLKNLATGEIQHFITMSSATSELQIMPMYGFSFASGTLYELWCNQVDDIAAQETIVIDAVQSLCYTLSFVRIKDTAYTTQILSIA